MKVEKFIKGLKHPRLAWGYLKMKIFDPKWAHTRMGFVPDLVSTDIAQMEKFRNLMRRYGAKTACLRTSGARVLEGSKVMGRIEVDNPRRIQVNRCCQIKDLTVKDDAHLLVDNNVKLDGVSIQSDTIITKRGVIKGRRLLRSGIVFSMELEAGVGLAHSSRVKEIFENPKAWNYARDSSMKLLQLFSQHEIPVTWFVCGHLFLESCDGKHPFKEKEWYGDWLKYDPATSYVDNKAWYMPDIVEMIVENSLFELGYHSFGHFNYIESSNKTIIEDVEMAKKIRKDFGIDLVSFSYPWNEVSRLHLLQKGGFKNIRGWIGTARAKGITEFGQSTKFFHTSGYLGPDPKYCDIPKLLKECLRESKVGPFTIFTHTHDFITKEDFSKLSLFLGQLGNLRETGSIRLERMDKM